MSSFLATIVDYGVLFSLVEIFKVWYVIAVATGSFLGAVVNFVLNRYWAFRAAHSYWHHQALRYTISSGLSLVLNTGGVYVVTEYIGLHYALSVVVVSILVGVLVNFPMQRFFVFK